MFDLQRFVTAQDKVYQSALSEIRAGHKQSHWMWFIFPQIAGLGHSPMAQRYAIQSLAEARAYLKHPVLGTRLQTCIAALLELQNGEAEIVFGSLDAIKLRSSLTLFIEAGGQQMFADLLARWFGGVKDSMTLGLLTDQQQGIN